MKSKVTILDLAKESGTSKSTISRYLQGENVSEEKKVRIDKAISNLGYIRNNFASFLRTNKSNILGVLVPDLDNPFFVKIVKTLEEQSQKLGKTLIIKTTRRNPEVELSAIEFIRGFLVDAIFLCRSELSDEILESLDIDVPLISLDKRFNSITSVVSNNKQCGYVITKHLFDNVSGNVMFFSRLKDSNSVVARSDGYKKYCLEANKKIFEYRYDVDKDVDYDDLLRFLQKNKIEGIIFRNDNDAIRTTSFLNEMASTGKINHIKICGFDNINLSWRIIPKLTTIDQKIENMCVSAFNLFMEYDEEKDPVLFVQQGELIIRDSSR